MFAVIETGGKQYVAEPGKKIKVEKLEIPDNSPVGGGDVVFDKILLKETESGLDIGHPYIEGSSVSGKVLTQGRDKKKIVFKFHSKNRYDKKKTHRQHYTEVEITGIK